MPADELPRSPECGEPPQGVGRAIDAPAKIAPRIIGRWSTGRVAAPADDLPEGPRNPRGRPRSRRRLFLLRRLRSFHRDHLLPTVAPLLGRFPRYSTPPHLYLGLALTRSPRIRVRHLRALHPYSLLPLLTRGATWSKPMLASFHIPPSLPPSHSLSLTLLLRVTPELANSNSARVFHIYSRSSRLQVGPHPPDSMNFIRNSHLPFVGFQHLYDLPLPLPRKTREKTNKKKKKKQRYSDIFYFRPSNFTIYHYYCKRDLR
jgi:hypothetical protein